MRNVDLLCVVAFWVGKACSYSDLAKQHNNPPMDTSPQCRQNALQVLHGDFGHALGERFCYQLSYAQKQLLALELTKCHLDEMQQATFEAPCELSIQECLAHLTPLGFQSYTLFKINVEQYCIKLNHELMILQQQETGAQLQQTAKLASEQLADLMQQQGEMQHEHSKLYASLREEQADLHQALLQQTIQRQQDSEQQLFEWTRQIMKGQEKQMQLQRQELQYFSTVVEKTASHIKPLLNLNAVLSWISGGVQFVNLFVYMYITVNLQWLLTLPRCVRTCRRKLWGIAVLEFLLSFSFIWLSDHRTKTNEQFIESIRVLSRILQATVYVLSFVSSFFAMNPRVAGGKQHQELLILLKNVNDSTEHIRRHIVERDRRLIQLLEEQKYDDRQQMILQYPPTRHVTATSPTIASAKSTEQFRYLHERQIVMDQNHIRDSASGSAGLIPSHRNEELEKAIGVQRILLTSPTDLASLQPIPNPDYYYFDAVSDSAALVTPPPQYISDFHASNMALNDKKRPGSDFHELEIPSKRLCANIMK
jgi:hypothetical protein